MSRMSATQAVDGDVDSEEHARSLLNRFLGAQVMLTGVESMMANSAADGGQGVSLSSMRTSTTTKQEQQSGSGDVVQGVDINTIEDGDTLRKLLDSCDAYEDRRKVRQRLKTLTANAKGGVSGSGVVASKRGGRDSSSTGSNALRTDNGSARNNTQASTQKSSYSTTSSSYSTQSSSKMTKGSNPFNKFQQMDAQQHTTRRASPFSLALPVIRLNAVQIKKIILDFCKRNTAAYESKGVKIENFSTSWNDGMAFCALIHHFYPDAFDFDKLSPRNRRYNFDLAFRTADEKAGVMALLDVEDMVVLKKPDWKCVFTYIQSLYKTLG